MSWIYTATGTEFDLRAPRVDQVALADIAHSLAQTNRYTGHARRPFSVAEHSLLVLDILERLFVREHDVFARLAAVLHDAHEAYCGDMATPIKGEVGEAWEVFEARVQRAVRHAFGVEAVSLQYRDWIKQADLIALATERAQLLPPGGTPWPIILHVQPVGWVDLMSPERCAMTWVDWRDRFTDSVQALEFACNDRAGVRGLAA